MTQQTSPFIEGKFGWALGESNWNLGMDENLLKFSYLFDRNIDGIVASLPAPVNGEAYFNTTDNRIYYVVNGVFSSTPVPKWFVVTLRSTGQVYQFNGINLSLGSSFSNELRDELESSTGSAQVGYQGPGTGSVPITVYDALGQFITNKTNGIPTGGSVDSTPALKNAEAQAYTSGDYLLLSGTYLITEDMEFRRQIITNGNVKFIGPDNGDLAPTIKISFTRRFDISGISFQNLIVSVAPISGTIAYAPVNVSRIDLFESQLIIGSEGSILSGFDISKVKATSGKSRTFSAIKIINVCDIDIHHNQIEEFSCGIEIAPTKSYAASQVKIRNNAVSANDASIKLSGTSKCRISKPVVENNTFAGSNRGPAGVTLGSVIGTFCTGLKFTNNKVSGKNDLIKLQGCLTSRIYKNEFIQHGTSLVFRFTSCRNTYFTKNKSHVNSTSVFLGIVGSGELNPIINGLYYKSANLVVEDNETYGGSYTLKIQNTDGTKHNRNTYEMTSAMPANSALWLSTGALNNRSYDNVYKAPSGTPVKLDAGITVDTAASPQTLVVTAAPATSVTAPVITTSDAALNNAKSYVVAFTVGSVKNIKGLENSTVKQTLTAWMATVPGATLGWNSSSWNVVDGRLPDVIVDGGLHEQAGLEDYYFAQSGMVLDLGNLLTCRDFFRASVDLNYPILVGAKSIEEESWQTAYFRAPLIVDGAIYDAVGSGIIPDQAGWDTALSARMCMGQKADLSYIILAVDGISGSSGCTMKQAAEKLLALGCVNAFNLDGGGSATLWYSGAVINNPGMGAGERPIPAVLYV